MRLKRFKRITELVLIFLGAAILLITFYAYELKLDNDAVMGNSRKSLGLIGVGCLFLAAISLASNQIRKSGQMRGAQFAWRLLIKVLEWIRESPAVAWFNQPLWLEPAWMRDSKIGRLMKRHTEIWAVSGALLVILVSFWYITSGQGVWTPYSSYFDRQADSFLAGRLALLEKPSAGLRALANPYDYTQREGLGYLWDVSFYQGQFYLYWGPIPAVLAAAVKLVHPGVVEDQYLLLFFDAGLACSLAALLHRLRKTFFPAAPAWTVLLLTLVGGLSIPVLWLVNRPSVYETSIAGGQFFLVLGVYAVLSGLEAQRGQVWLAIAGLAWGAAVGCRMNNAIAVIWMTGLVCLYCILRSKGTWGWVIPVLCLGAPLLAFAAGLGGYNLARFGNVMETGHRYQLTGPALPADYSRVTSVQYILPNLYNLLFRPLDFSWDTFPFVFAPYISGKMWPSFIRLPDGYYYSEPIAGILRSIPIDWLIVLPFLRQLWRGWTWVHERPEHTAEQAPPLLSWIWWIIAGATLGSLFFLSVFIMSTMRYLADLTPLMTVWAGMGIWWGLDFVKNKPGLRRLLLIGTLTLGLMSVWIGLFVNFHGGAERFEWNNPHLYRAIARFFMGK